MTKFAKIVETPQGEQVVLMRVDCDCGCGCTNIHAAMHIADSLMMRVITAPMTPHDEENITKAEYIALMNKEFEQFGPMEAQEMYARAIADFETPNHTIN